MVPNPNRRVAVGMMRHESSLQNNAAACVNDETSPCDSVNPYAYPYFHSNGTAPVLYELVVKFAASCNNNQAESGKRLTKRIQSRCMVMPKEVLWRDSCGDTALHRLCQVVPVVRQGDEIVLVARAMIQACPIVTATVNNWSETPLHQFVTHCGISTKTPLQQREHSLELLMDLVRLLSNTRQVVQRRNYVGALPLHVACELAQRREDKEESLGQGDNTNPCDQQEDKEEHSWLDWTVVLHTAIVKHLLTLYPIALYTVDNIGRTPLHHAVASNVCSAEVVQVLLEELLSCTATPSKEDNRVLLESVLVTLWNNAPAATHEPSPLQLIVWEDSFGKLRDGEHFLAWHKLELLWSKAVLIFRAATTLSSSDTHKHQDDWNLVHSAMVVGAPLVVILLAISLHPHELHVVDAMTRQTPLAMAVARRFVSEPCVNPMGDLDVVRFELNEGEAFETMCNNDGNNNKSSTQTLLLLLRHLIATDPRAASVVDETTGRLPLHYAIENDMKWKHGVQILFQAEPRAIAARDPVTRLYPFMLAAVPATCTRSTSSEEVSTIYELLRADPSVVAFS